MSEVVFRDKSKMPDADMLKAALKETYLFYESIVRMTEEKTLEWKFYSPKSGWTLKVFDKKKALCWITPYDAHFNLSMAVRDVERESLLQLGELSPAIREKLETAEKYPEGWALRITVVSEADFHDAEAAISQVMKIREAK